MPRWSLSVGRAGRGSDAAEGLGLPAAVRRRAMPWVGAGAVLVLAGVAIVASAGPLNPPAGPVAPTYKTLAEVEPRIPIGPATTPGDADSLYRITQPGSYYLTGNVAGVAGKIGVQISVSGVTLDLMGHTLRGVPGSWAGVGTDVGEFSNITVRNGTVVGWGHDGINLAYGGFGEGGLVEDVHASGNTGRGILLNYNAIARNCTASDNGGAGIFASFGALIESCVARSNGGDGISVDYPAVISRCVADSNAGNGIWGGSYCRITDCAAAWNGMSGIVANGDCLVRGNTCSQNGHGGPGDAAGIHARSSGNRIDGNTCSNNSRGVRVINAGNFITRNTCRTNFTNWDVVAGNVCYVVNAVASPAVVGNAGGVPPGSADPNANFSF